MSRSKEWLVPLTGVAFVLVTALDFGASLPPSADKPVAEIVDFYVDKKTSIQISATSQVVAGLLLIIFGAYLRKVLRAAAPEDEVLPLVAFIGLVIVAVGDVIDATIFFALAEAAKDIDPVAVQALQALWDNDFLPAMLGVLAFLVATGISIIQSGVLPKWLGWVMLLLLLVIVIVGLTPVGFIATIYVAFGAMMILVLVLSVMLTLRAR